MLDLLAVLSKYWDFVVIIVVLLGASVYFGRRIGRMEAQIQQVLKSIGALMASNSFLIGALVKQKILSAERLLDVMQPYRDLSSRAIDELIQSLRPTGNPITQDQVNRLIELLKKATANKSLEYDEAVEFYELAKKVVEEFPPEPIYQRLLSFAAFILGQATSTVPA